MWSSRPHFPSRRPLPGRRTPGPRACRSPKSRACRWAAPRFAGILLTLGALHGCGDGDDEPHLEPVVRDSMGVIIHEYPADVLDHPARLRLAEEPTVRIGVVEGPTEYQWTRPVAGSRLPDGRFVILEQVPGELRIFDPGGTFLSRIGRPGEGPGELSNAAGLAVIPPDTFLVWDSRARRLSWFSGQGALVRERTLRDPGGIQALRRVALGPGGGGVLLGTTSGVDELENRGRIRETWSVLPVAPDGEVGNSLGTMPGTETMLQVQRSGPGPDGIVSVNVQGRWWWGQTFAWPAHHGVWTADRLRLEARHFHLERGADRMVRINAPDRPFTRALIDSLHAVELDRIDDPEIRRLLQDDFLLREYPDGVPPVEAIFADRAGRIWLGLTDLPRTALPSGGFPALRRWLVFAGGAGSGDGAPHGIALVGVMTIPPLSHPLWADDEGVLLVRNDETLGVARVEWYPYVEP